MQTLTFRQRLTWAAHLYKALVKQHHGEMRPLLARFIKSDSVVIDVGAHSGQFAKLFAALAPGGKVYAFEPGSYPRSILEKVVAWRGLANVEVIRAGLSDAPGALILETPLKKSGSLGFGLAHFGQAHDGRQTAAEKVPILKLDDFAAERGLTRVDFIKADVEGWEGRMVAGALGVIQRHRPVLLLELVADHLARAGDKAESLFDQICAQGYRAERLTGPATSSPAKRFESDGDYIFLPN